MAHNVSDSNLSSKVQSWMTLAKFGLCAFVLLPLINLLSLLIGHAEMDWGYCNKNTSMHDGYLLFAWVYVTYTSVCSTSTFRSRAIASRGRSPAGFRIGYVLVVFVSAMIIFHIFYKLNFLDRPMKTHFKIDQELLVAVGFV